MYRIKPVVAEQCLIAAGKRRGFYYIDHYPI